MFHAISGIPWCHCILQQIFENIIKYICYKIINFCILDSGVNIITLYSYLNVKMFPLGTQYSNKFELGRTNI